MPKRELLIEGARQNNLKNINLCLPHDRFIVITGLSGSGKSSLAFDTLFAEGQWRFIESLSTYARVFIEKLNRPDVDRILNIRPSIALQQHNPVKGSRSTVGTLTEIYDFLRSIYANISVPYCPRCGRELRRWDANSLSEYLFSEFPNKRAMVMFKTDEAIESLIMRGFDRVWENGQVVSLSEYRPDNDADKIVIVDRLVLRKEERLYDSIGLAWREGRESIRVMIFPEDTGISSIPEELIFSSDNACNYCNLSLPQPSAVMFSFNHPLYACKRCKGFGNILIYDENALVPDKGLSLSDGAFGILEMASLSWWKEQMLEGAKKSGIDLHRPYRELSQEDRDVLFSGNRHFYGISGLFEELEAKRYKLHVRVFLSRYRIPVECPECKGKRLSSDALAYKIKGLDIADLCSLSVDSLLRWFDELVLSPMQQDSIKEALKQIKKKLNFLKRVGLGYLTLSRLSKTLSGGEYQRLNLANQLASQLTGTLYVLDEPTIGLHPQDTQRIIDILKELVSLGNSVVVVEHDSDVIASSDYVVEMGPQGGAGGGEVVFSGFYEDFLHTDTLTARSLRDDALSMLPARDVSQSSSKGHIVISGASGNNLQALDINIPIGKLTVVTGLSGSGKSSLIVETLYPAAANYFKTDSVQPLPFDSIKGLSLLRGVRLIDQTPIGKTPRSNPATYLKIFDAIRRIYSLQPESKAYGYSSGFFSFNIQGGRCEACKGEGFQKIEMYFFEDVYVRCEECEGSRYNREALRVRYKGKNISQVLQMSIAEAAVFFGDQPEILGKLRLLQDMGLGYLRLGQPANTLSGGEAQRLKICSELMSQCPVRGKGNKGMLYILDEPSVGLHYYDVINLMHIIFRLLRAGNTVVIIEHNLDIISLADYIIDLGPEGGDAGGRVIFQGSPLDILDFSHSITGRHLKKRQERKQRADGCCNNPHKR